MAHPDNSRTPKAGVGGGNFKTSLDYKAKLRGLFLHTKDLQAAPLLPAILKNVHIQPSFS